MTRRLALNLVLAVLAAQAAAPAPAQEKLDWGTLGRIRDEGFRRSQVMETAGQLTDVHGPRLTGSPQYKVAAEWARQQLETWGLASAHLESWSFGRGWSFERCSAHVVSPMVFPLVALPKAWTAGTNGPVRGKVLRVKAESEADVEKLKGQIAGLVLWVGQPRELRAPEDGGVFKRYTEKQLDEIEQYQIPGPRGGRGPAGPVDRETFLRRRRVQQALEKLYAAEKPLAVVEPSERDANVLRLGGARSYKKGDPQPVTQLVVSAPQWNRVARLLDRNTDVEVELDVKAAFHEDDTNGYNVVAELPGTDKKGELVMVGAHLDSWHPGTGATDNAAGSAVMMEAIRILKAIDARPRRTVRLGLWGGEEQGLLGSRAYVSEHFASRPEPKEAGPDELPSFMRNDPPAPITLKPDHAKLSGYFNLDNGTGKIRGVYLQENAAMKPVFEAWMETVKDLGATRISMRNTGGTDHQSFDGAGLPGFQFIQDPIEYMDGTFFGTHHTDMDVYDRLQREDLMQAAVVIATFVYEAAMREELLPRKPLPPVATPLAPGPAPGGKAGPSGGTKPAPKAREAAPGAGGR
jgi:carboxypeptidase Q